MNRPPMTIIPTATYIGIPTEPSTMMAKASPATRSMAPLMNPVLKPGKMLSMADCCSVRRTKPAMQMPSAVVATILMDARFAFLQFAFPTF